jgi:uncharacterized protein YkwD
MILGWLPVVCFIASASPTSAAITPVTAEQQGTVWVRREFERVGRRSPWRDDSLDRAARALAERALKSGAKQAGDLLSISLAVSAGGSFDPNPRTILIQGPREDALRTLLARRDLGRDPASHFGLGAVTQGEALALVVVLVERRAMLKPFARAAASGAVQELCGELEAPLERAEVFVTRPKGAVDRVPLTKDQGQRFCATVPFPASGRHQVEVVGRGPKGPEVAALFFVDVGSRGQTQVAISDRIEEPRTAEDARRELLERINALRRAHGAQPVELDPKLSAVAQHYSERMAQEGFFAHVDPTGKNLQTRLAEARVGYDKAGENLGMADGPLAAHFAIELSPGHRRNLLDPSFSLLGVGVAVRQLEGRSQCLLTEVLARASRPSSNPSDNAYQAIARVRKNHKLPALTPLDALERLAEEQARRLVEADDPEAPAATQRLHDKVFKTLREARSAAVDVFIADDPGKVPESQNLKDAKNQWVGVGTMRAESRRYGLGRTWVVVIYASPR